MIRRPAAMLAAVVMRVAVAATPRVVATPRVAATQLHPLVAMQWAAIWLP
jgi:hypothetical protein